MHSANTAYETLELLWNNYIELATKVDPEAMDTQALARYANCKHPVRPFRISTWLARQGYFVAAWGLWEYYSGKLCDKLPSKVERRKGKSHVEWVRNSLEVNAIEFPESGWFNSANCLRNLIAHHGGRVAGPRAESLIKCASMAFTDIEAYADGYIAITHCQVADLQLKVEDFIQDMATVEPLSV